MATKLRILESEKFKRYLFFCPGCQRTHSYDVGNTKPSWNFNGNLELPTFTPSLLCNQHYPSSRCHLHITNGKIIYCNDCHHELKGQTVDMVDL